MAGCLLMMGLVSCEMKNEILGKDDNSAEKGLLNLGVAVDAKSNDMQTKADDSADPTIPFVSANGYIVEINKSDDKYKTTLTYDPENATIELPTGSYTVYAHKDGDPTTDDTEPYYGGKSTFSISLNNSTDVSVVCKMENTKIQLIYSQEMQTAFIEGKITVTAGSRTNFLSFSQTNFKQPAPFYWMMDEGVKVINVSFVGTNKYGEPIRESRSITKPEGAETLDWVGGDALAITLKPGAYEPSDPDNPDNPGDPTGVTGIDISAEVTWDNQNDPVDIPVIDDGEEPDGKPGDDDAPTITGDCIGKELTYKEGGEKPVIAISMNVPGRIKDVRVQIKSTNTAFESMLSDLDGIDLTKEGGETLINNAALKKLFDLPEADKSGYDFTLSEMLFGMLSAMTGTHTFNLFVEDQLTQDATASFKVTIQE